MTNYECEQVGRDQRLVLKTNEEQVIGDYQEE